MVRAPPKTQNRADDVLEDWSPPALDILWAIAQWYNGAVLKQDNQRYHIGWHRPPDLQTLLGCSDVEWEQRYEAVFTDLQAPATSPTLVDDQHSDQSEESQPWLTEQYILRRKVRWTPTRSARNAMDTLFAGLFDADDSHSTSSRPTPASSATGTSRFSTALGSPSSPRSGASRDAPSSCIQAHRGRPSRTFGVQHPTVPPGKPRY